MLGRRKKERNIDFYTLALSSIVQSSGRQYWERRGLRSWGGGNVIKDNIRAVAGSERSSYPVNPIILNQTKIADMDSL